MKLQNNIYFYIVTSPLPGAYLRVFWIVNSTTMLRHIGLSPRTTDTIIIPALISADCDIVLRFRVWCCLVPSRQLLGYL